MLLMVVYSFFGSERTELGPFTLDNYLAAWSSPSFRDLYLRTLLIGVVVTLLALMIAIPVAFHLSIRSRRASSWLAVLLLPYLVGYVPRILAIRLVFGAGGLLGTFVSAIGLSSDLVRPLMFSNIGTIIGALYTQLPVMVVLIYLAVERIDRQIIDAAVDLGAGTWRLVFTVIIPNARVGIAAACVLVFATVFGSYAEPSLLGGASGQLAATVIATRFEVFLDWGRGSALALSALAVIALFGLVVLGGVSAAGRIRGAKAQ
jgi:spermidine/putrescine transport system permease protein